MITLHQISPDEWPLWRELRLSALTDSPASFSSKLADWISAPEQQWRERLSREGVYAAIAFSNERPVGMVGGLPPKPAAAAGIPAELVSLWVEPKARGTGIGDLLIQGVEAWTRQSGGTRLQLSVVKGNMAAYKLYRRNGFEVANDERDDERDENRMVKVLI
ncbi:hypothetical protein ASPZODRAFT_137325 [Penicilliopsis zonata CBS 506.65]|uniref:N-acetyltransferase domain-containing protein n=1 Tax=Penicilliopsis zonata CBS 506.65 TaxID=1073090 RepID=A0A1L9S5K2_9EURO|nr:hypothetical protein ASPZODRAFT_137325 [Penicilliopsis zonata CBS 506.65]OJJ42417.1 hypothetical protein ASPZODRAFT_137325 [Penicilliopsis zonata CBS 506.65]